MQSGPRCSPFPHWRGNAVAALAVCALGGWWAPPAFAQGAGKPVPRASAEQGLSWTELKPAQQDALRPLEREWHGIDTRSKQKWLELSARFPKLSPPARARVQERMAEWAKLTPRERGEARLNFQDAKQFPTEDREARWKAYQALTPEQRQQLAARADAARAPAPVPGGKRAREPQAKSNIVPSPADSASPRTVEPTVVQGRPGATTSLITKRPSPPEHQQTGLPKIAATPGFVDSTTLLPKRGAQGAATRPAPVADQPSKRTK
jgi:hypothetical protein